MLVEEGILPILMGAVEKPVSINIGFRGCFGQVKLVHVGVIFQIVFVALGIVLLFLAYSKLARHAGTNYVVRRHLLVEGLSAKLFTQVAENVGTRHLDERVILCLIENDVFCI